MGLLKRNRAWRMSLMYQGLQVRRSTSTTDKRLAESILAKVKVQIAEGRFFETREEQERTFREMMDRYLTERVVLKAPKSRLRDQAALGHLLPRLGDKVLAHITPKVMASYKVQRRMERAAPATINKELQLVRHAFNLAMREWPSTQECGRARS